MDTPSVIAKSLDMFTVQSENPKINIHAKSIAELELALSYFNPLFLHHANNLLKKKYNLVACGIGPDIECVFLEEEVKKPVEISVIYVRRHK